MKYAVVFLCMFTVLGLAACKEAGSEGGRQSSGIATSPSATGVTWILQDMNAAGIIDNSNITLTFAADHRLVGNTGCNHYTGQYALDGSNLKINQDITATERACAVPAMMEQEQEFLRELPKADRVVLDETGALVLSGNAGTRLLFRAE